MPDYHKPDLTSGTIPEKPRNFDEAARASQQADQRAIDANRAEGKAMEADKEQRREGAGRRADATEKAGPAERMYGQGRMVNANTQKDQTKQTPRAAPKPEMTAAQQQMAQKREAARAQDRQVAEGKREPEKHYAELQKKDQSPSR